MIIYKITNLVNNKIYVGQTTKTAEQRLAKHWSEALCKSRPNNYFHNALLKYGIDAFVIEEIDTASTLDELNEKEAYWIEKLNARDKSCGYNLMTGGKSGIKSDETRELLRQRKAENWKDENLIPRMLNGLRKGTEKWKSICVENRVEFVCPVCGAKQMLPKWEAEDRKYCSLECSKNSDLRKEMNKVASEKAASIKKEYTRKRKGYKV